MSVELQSTDDPLQSVQPYTFPLGAHTKGEFRTPQNESSRFMLLISDQQLVHSYLCVYSGYD